VDYPAIRAAHEASCLASPGEVRAWRESRSPGAGQALDQGPTLPLRPPADLPADSIDEVILRRGSARRFDRRAISFAQLSTLLHHATRGIPADFLDGATASLNDLYLIANAVDGLEAGTHVYHRDRDDLELLRHGDFRDEAGYLDLQQDLAADASVNCYMLSNLTPVLNRFGSRGYRAAALEAAIVGGKLYLAAYAQRLGATGLTFFDDDVTDFFSPHGAGKSVMFLVAAGRRVRRT
jgi:nitroreductase